MLTEVKKALQAMIDDDSFSFMMASLMKKNYDALVTAGFSEEQAMAIIASGAFKIGG